MNERCEPVSHLMSAFFKMRFARACEKSVGYFRAWETVYLIAVIDTIIMLVHIGVGLWYECSLHVSVPNF